MNTSGEKGYVYILTNPSFRNDWVKIGKSVREVNVRSKELDNTAVPLPFEVFAWIKTSKYNEVEILVHKTIDRLTSLRIRQNREFFNIPPEQAYDILKDISSTLDDAELWCKNDKPKKRKKAEDEPKKPRRKPFTFSNVDIPIGAELTFIPTGIKVTVASDRTVEYENRLYKLSPFASIFLPEEMKYPSGAYQGALYFTYDGERLTDRRRRFEESERKSDDLSADLSSESDNDAEE